MHNLRAEEDNKMFDFVKKRKKVVILYADDGCACSLACSILAYKGR